MKKLPEAGAERAKERAQERDDAPVLPEQTRDDTDRGWGGGWSRDSNDERLLADRPPHWD